MTKCNCGFRTGDTGFHQPWCATTKSEVPLAPNNIAHFVNWNSEKPEDIMQQVLDWIRWHKKEGHTVHVVGCLVHVEPDKPDQRHYQPFFTPTPSEILHYAAFRIQQRSWEKLQEDPV